MNVEVEGGFYVGMSKEFADGFTVGSVLDEECCKSMSECMDMLSVDTEFFAGVFVISSE